MRKHAYDFLVWLARLCWAASAKLQEQTVYESLPAAKPGSAFYGMDLD